MYGKETLRMNEVWCVLNSKEIQRKDGYKEDYNSELILMRGRSEIRGSKGRGKARSKFKTSKKCFHYHEEGHFRKDC